MAEPLPTPDRRRFRYRWLLLLLVPVLSLAVPGYRYVASATVIDMALVGESCGNHVTFQPDGLLVGPGQRVRFDNNTQFWPIQLRLTADDVPGSPVLAESPVLQPGESWTFLAWRPQQRYFVTATNTNLYWAGLRGWLLVGW